MLVIGYVWCMLVIGYVCCVHEIIHYYVDRMYNFLHPNSFWYS